MQRVYHKTGYSIQTGHPPPLVQVKGQVRSSTGMTFAAGGQMVALSPRLPAVSVGPAVPVITPPTASTLKANDSAKPLFDYLRALTATEVSALPGLKSIAAILGAGWTPSRVASGFRTLERYEPIHMWTRVTSKQYGVRVIGERLQLRTRSAPEGVTV